MSFSFISPNFKMVTVLINPSNGNTPASQIFQPEQELQDRKIIAIESFTNADVAFDPLNTGTPIMPIASAQYWFLTLYTSGVKNQLMFSQKQEAGLFYDKIPYGKLRAVSANDTAATGSSFSRNGLFIIRPTELAFNKCKVEAPTSAAQGAAYSACFGFHYLDKDDDGLWWMDAMGYGGKK
jgi:hypothetical protein